MALQAKAFNDLISFTRASGAGRFNSAGNFEWLAANQQRFDYNPITKLIKGLLVEESRTNFVTRSSDFLRPTWFKRGTCVVEPAVVAAPDGTLTGNLVSGLSAGLNDLYVQVGGYAADQVVSPSIFIKKVTPTGFININNPIGGTGVGSWTVDLSKLSSSWERITRTHMAVTVAVEFKASTGGLAGIQLKGFDSAVISLNLWGAQIEAGSYETSHIPTPSTFTSRSSTALYFDAAGVLQTAAINAARSNAYGYDSDGVLRPIGLLVEAAATNLLRYSSDFVASAWLKRGTTTVAAGVGPTAPAGGFGNYVQGIGAAAINDIFQTAGTGTSGDRNEPSLFIAKGGSTGVLAVQNASSTAGGGKWLVDLARLSANYQRITRSHPAVTVVNEFIYSNGNNTGIHLFRESGDIVLDFYVWGAQVEAGSITTSHIPTTSAQVTRADDISTSVQITRAADVPRVNVLSPWFNPLEGTLLVEGSTVARTGNAYFASLGASAGNYILLWQSGNGPRPGFNVVVSNIGQAGLTDPVTGALLSNTKMAGAYKKDDFAFSANGALSGTDVSGNVPPAANITQMGIGWAPFGSPLNGWIRSFKYFPRRLSNAELQALTV